MSLLVPGCFAMLLVLCYETVYVQGSCTPCSTTNCLGGNCCSKERTEIPRCTSCNLLGDCSSCDSSSVLNIEDATCRLKDGQWCDGNSEQCSSGVCYLRCCNAKFIEGCVECTSSGKCNKCKDGWMRDSSTASCLLSPGRQCKTEAECFYDKCLGGRCCGYAMKNCLQCDSNGGCLACAFGYVRVDGECKLLLGDGGICKVDMECEHGNCKSRCCGGKGKGPECTRCDSSGVCDYCSHGHVLQDGECKIRLGSSCRYNGECISGACRDGVCCDIKCTTCTAGGGYCKTCVDGYHVVQNQCVQLRPDGAECNNDNLCQSGLCRSNRCCGNFIGRKYCQACTTSGVCSRCQYSNGLVAGQCLASNGNSCTNGTECTSAICTGNICCAPATDLTGCLQCGGSRSECTKCDTAHYVIKGWQCKLRDGRNCSSDDQCYNSKCLGGRCCDSGRKESCTACNEVGECSACDPSSDRRLINKICFKPLGPNSRCQIDAECRGDSQCSSGTCCNVPEAYACSSCYGKCSRCGTGYDLLASGRCFCNATAYHVDCIGTNHPTPWPQFDNSMPRDLFLQEHLFAEPVSDLLNNLTNLEKISLLENELTAIPSTFFLKTTKLIVITLSKNKLKTLPLFSGLDSLQSLYLDNNELTSLNVSQFNGLRNLQRLDLSYNFLRKLIPGTFNGLQRLESLLLQHNSLEEILPGTLDNLSKLESILLNHNSIKTLALDFLKGSPFSNVDFENNLLACRKQTTIDGTRLLLGECQCNTEHGEYDAEKVVVRSDVAVSCVKVTTSTTETSTKTTTFDVVKVSTVTVPMTASAKLTTIPKSTEVTMGTTVQPGSSMNPTTSSKIIESTPMDEVSTQNTTIGSSAELTDFRKSTTSSLQLKPSSFITSSTNQPTFTTQKFEDVSTTPQETMVSTSTAPRTYACGATLDPPTCSLVVAGSEACNDAENGPVLRVQCPGLCGTCGGTAKSEESNSEKSGIGIEVLVVLIVVIILLLVVAVIFFVRSKSAKQEKVSLGTEAAKNPQYTNPAFFSSNESTGSAAYELPGPEYNDIVINPTALGTGEYDNISETYANAIPVQHGGGYVEPRMARPQTGGDPYAISNRQPPRLRASRPPAAMAEGERRPQTKYLEPTVSDHFYDSAVADGC
eukprot:m.6309 g.6309  ORF g.6309 m.6309 type:complete len:1143 (-) comp3517_c0_seq1:86-3514(-)